MAPQTETQPQAAFLDEALVDNIEGDKLHSTTLQNRNAATLLCSLEFVQFIGVTVLTRFTNSKTKKQIALSLVAFSVVALVAWSLLLPGKIAHSPAPASATQQAHAELSGNIRFVTGAAQLSMIQTQSLPLVPIPIAEQLSARVAYDEEVTARIGVSFTGRITELKAAPGDAVKIGQVLAVIDSPDFGTAFADLNKARADEKRKQLSVKRAKDLVPGEAISTRDWEAVQAEFSQAQAETARAEQRIKNLNPHGFKSSGQQVILASPVAGVVTERTASPSLEINPNLSAPLFIVTDPKRLWVSIDLPEALLSKVKLGSEVSIQSDAYPEEIFNAKIIQLGQTINPNTRRANVLARVDNPDGKLLPEMFVRAAVLQTNGQGVQVPNRALLIRGLYTYVFVEKTTGDFTLQKVKPLKRGVDVSYIGEGLLGGERVVTKGALLLEAEFLASLGEKQ
jgi:cobalt-zinc-cadmium efflux system membrane fusion protein